jgi:hypothetical protein
MGEVLAMDNAAPVNSRFRLHAAGCQALRSYNGKRGRRVITEDVAEEVANAEELGYPVARCKCLKKAEGK